MWPVTPSNARHSDADIRHFDYTRGGTGYADDLATLVDLVASGRLHPELGMVRPWTDTRAAIEALRVRRVRGNVVLALDPHLIRQQEE